jgi:hypothetical protein
MDYFIRIGLPNRVNDAIQDSTFKHGMPSSRETKQQTESNQHYRMEKSKKAIAMANTTSIEIIIQFTFFSLRNASFILARMFGKVKLG